MIKINAGSGNHQHEGYVNVDMNPATFPDVVHDLTVYPWPFEDHSADEIMCVHVLEHLIHQGNAEEFFAFFRECWRILRAGGLLRVVVPDAHSDHAFSDPWHKSAWSREIFAFISRQSIADNVKSGTRMTPIELDFDFALHSLDTVNGNIMLNAVAVK
jgi:predicted SAM-dependent methyltransferase